MTVKLLLDVCAAAGDTDLAISRYDLAELLYGQALAAGVTTDALSDYSMVRLLLSDGRTHRAYEVYEAARGRRGEGGNFVLLRGLASACQAELTRASEEGDDAAAALWMARVIDLFEDGSRRLEDAQGATYAPRAYVADEWDAAEVTKPRRVVFDETYTRRLPSTEAAPRDGRQRQRPLPGEPLLPGGARGTDWQRTAQRSELHVPQTRSTDELASSANGLMEVANRLELERFRRRDQRPSRPAGGNPFASAAALGEPYYTKGGWDGERGGEDEWAAAREDAWWGEGADARWGEGGDERWGEGNWAGADGPEATAPTMRRRAVRPAPHPELPEAVANKGHLRRAKARRREREERRAAMRPRESHEGRARMPQAGEIVSRQARPAGSARRGRVRGAAAEEAEVPTLVRLGEARRRRSGPSW